MMKDTSLMQTGNDVEKGTYNFRAAVRHAGPTEVRRMLKEGDPAKLASHFAVSPSHLSRTFKRVTGFGIREYLVNLRIQRACELLLPTTLSITEIADRCGFNDSNYFGDAFHKAIGISPRDYRKLG